MFENILPEVVQRSLAHVLHDASLEVLHGEAQHKRGQKSEHDELQSPQGRGQRDEAARSGHDVLVNSVAEQVGSDDLERTYQDGQHKRQDDAPTVRPQIGQQSPCQPRIVGLAQCFFFAKIAHSRSNSSSSNCF